MSASLDELFDRAAAAQSAGQVDLAQSLFEQVLEIAPDDVPALVNLGTIYQGRGADDAAEALYRRALSFAPDTAFAHHNLANLLLKRGDRAGAIESWRAAVDIDPDNAFLRFNLAGALELARDLEGALAQLDAILAHAPDDLPAHMAKVPILFDLGRIPEAWQQYAYRHHLFWNTYPGHRRPLPSPLWRGEPLAGKKLLVSYDQGLGEQIMFASMFPRLLAQGARLVIECEARLVNLFARSFPRAQVVPWQQPWNPAVKALDIDFHIPAGDVGRWLQNACDRPAPPHGHLTVDLQRTAALRAKYEALAGGRKIVGLSWHSAAKGTAHLKSLPLGALKPIIEDPALFCISVQYGAEAKNAAPLYVDSAVDPTTDMDAAAAQIAAMDEVVTISNTAAHLAGALGKPTYLMLPKTKGRIWYWFPERAQNPWYASTRAFVQKTDGVWSDVVADVGAAIHRA